MKWMLRTLTLIALMGGLGLSLGLQKLQATTDIPPTAFIGFRSGAGCFCPTRIGDCACIYIPPVVPPEDSSDTLYTPRSLPGWKTGEAGVLNMWRFILWFMTAMCPEHITPGLTDTLMHFSRELVPRIAVLPFPPYTSVTQPVSQFHLAGCDAHQWYVADLTARIVYVLSHNHRVIKHFFIRMDHTPPFQMFEMQGLYVLVAYRDSVGPNNMKGNLGTWIQVYDTAGLYIQSMFPTPEPVRNLGWAGGFEARAVPGDSLNLYVVMTIGDCIWELSLADGMTKPFYCGLVKKLGIQAARKAGMLYPGKEAPTIVDFRKTEGSFILVAKTSGGETKILHIP